MSETELVLQAQTGDETAFSLIVSTYSHRIYRAAYSFMKNMDDSADIVQEVFIRAYRNINGFDSNRPLYPWLYRIVKNLCINAKNKKNSKEVSLPDYDLPAGYDGPETVLLKDQEAANLRKCLLRLPDNYREILVLKHFQECSYAEIADILAVPIGTVMSRLYNARKKLQAEIEKEV